MGEGEGKRIVLDEKGMKRKAPQSMPSLDASYNKKESSYKKHFLQTENFNMDSIWDDIRQLLIFLNKIMTL